MTWDDVCRMIGEPKALPNKMINWRGTADCPTKGWIVTTLNGPRCKLNKPDGYYPDKNELHVSDEDIKPATKRMLESPCRYDLYVFHVGGGVPAPYTFLGMRKSVRYVVDPDYPHWIVELL